MHTPRKIYRLARNIQGRVPCADCEGIAIELQLLPNGTYTLSTQYLGKGKQVFVNTGSFTWNAQGSDSAAMQTARQDQYQVGETSCFTRCRRSAYHGRAWLVNILTKATAMPALPVENKKWQLIAERSSGQRLGANALSDAGFGQAPRPPKRVAITLVAMISSHRNCISNNWHRP